MNETASQARAPLVRLSGTSGEMGYDHGRILRDKVHTAVEHYVFRSGEYYDTPTSALMSESKRCRPFIAKRFVEEIEGLAEGSGVRFEALLALNCIPDIDGCYTQKALQCCNFVLSPPATAGHLFLHGRNLDFPTAGGIARDLTALILRTPPPPLHATLAIGFAGFVGLLTGCSDRRLSVGEVSVPDRGAQIDGTPISFLLRDALEKSQSVQEFFGVLHSAERVCGYNIAVSDAARNESAAIETTRRLCEMRKPKRGVLVVDDVCFCRNTAANRLTYPAGVFRYARLMALIHARYGSIGGLEALSFLSDTHDASIGRPNRRSPNAICNRQTVQSVLFDASARVIHVAAGSPAYTRIDESRLWGDPEYAGAATCPELK